jgi:RNA polymerase sigma-70 factor (ECF subfamily)
MNPSKRSAEKVEELAQDILMSIHQKRSTYRPEMPILPWIYAVARYRLIDSIRQEARRPKTVVWDEAYEEIPDTRPAAAESLGLTPGAADVEALLSGLNDRQREILVLSKVTGMPLADIASKMNMSLSAVKDTIHRTLRSIRKNREGGPNEVGNG